MNEQPFLGQLSLVYNAPLDRIDIFGNGIFLGFITAENIENLIGNLSL